MGSRYATDRPFAPDPEAEVYELLSWDMPGRTKRKASNTGARQKRTPRL